MREDLARALADAFLAGPWDRAGLYARGALVLRRRRPWLPRLVTQVLAVYPTAPLDRPRELVAVVRSRPVAEQATTDRPVARAEPVASAMVRNPWHLPRLDTVADLAALTGLDDLAWYADVKGLARTAPDEALLHYRSSWQVAASGGTRVLEAPKPRLKAAQRRLLAQVLHGIPPHDAAHGFRPHRSVATYAAPHAGKAVVLRLDLEGFFSCVTAGRVFGILHAAGYPEAVAHALTGLCTTVLPRWRWRQVPNPGDPALLDAHWRLGRRLAAPHLPQGAPTSPGLANLAAYRLDVRLSALAQAWGGTYTRYADDLALSGGRGWGRGTSRLLDAVGEVAVDEGFRLAPHKTGVMPRAGRQSLGGLVVNARPQVARPEVDLLRAVLHHCVHDGPSTQNREGRPDFEAYLRGRVAWVCQHSPSRAQRLRDDLARVDWTR